MASFILRKRQLLHDVIFPIFDANPLLTKKYYDFIEIQRAFVVLSGESTQVEKNEKMIVIKERLCTARKSGNMSPV
jgi:hypothetical protein